MAERTPAGQFNKRIRIVALVDRTGGASGQPKLTPTIRYSAWAKIVPLSGREMERARQVLATVTHEIRMPYRRSGPVPANQVRFVSDGVEKIFNIGTVLDVEEGHFEFVLMCTQVVV